MQERRVQSLGLKDPVEEEMATIPVFLPGKPYRGIWWVPEYPKSQKQLSRWTFTHTHTHTHTHTGEIQSCFAEITVTIYGRTQAKLQISSSVPFLPPQSVNSP